MGQTYVLKFPNNMVTDFIKNQDNLNKIGYGVYTSESKELKFTMLCSC